MNKTKSTFLTVICLVLVMLLGVAGCDKSVPSTESTEHENTDTEAKISTVNKIKLTIGSNEIMAELADNDSAKELAELLQDGPITMSASNHGGVEKICKLGTSLTNNDTQIKTETGDIMLYNSNQIVIFYNSNSCAYTRLAKVVEEDMDSLEEVLSGEESTVVIELASEKELNAAPNVTLNSGYEMPVFGLGTYALEDDVCVDSVYTAIQEGYKLIDTAYMYHNEEAVGEAVRKAIDNGLVTREEMFITTKLYPNQFDNPEGAIEQALEKLDIGYIDLMLLHHPGDGDVSAYKAIEKYIEDGKIRSVGLSNWYIKELDAFLPQVDTVPALIQNEIHPYYQELEVVPYIQSKGIVVEGWYPLGGRGHQTELLTDPVLEEIADSHEKTVAQVILRWNVQRGVIVIPGSSNPEHIAENIAIFDFELTEDEIEKIMSLEKNEKHDWY